MLLRLACACLPFGFTGQQTGNDAKDLEAKLEAHASRSESPRGTRPIEFFEKQSKEIKMPRGGKRHGSGRPQGSLNKATAEWREDMKNSGLTPLEHLLAVMLDETADAKRRDWAAKEAAPYLHPRLASTKIEGEDREPLVVLVREFCTPDMSKTSIAEG